MMLKLCFALIIILKLFYSYIYIYIYIYHSFVWVLLNKIVKKTIICNFFKFIYFLKNNHQTHTNILERTLESHVKSLHFECRNLKYFLIEIIIKKNS
jgi:hypothetical protein